MIELQGVGKTYRNIITRKSVHALRDFSITLKPGEVFGIAGPNGAGKTTLLALLLGYLKPTAGTIHIEQTEPRAWVERFGVAYLSELIGIPRWWKTDGTLHRYALLEDLAPAERKTKVEGLIERLGLTEHRGKRVKQLSKGNLQRLGLAQALLSDSRLIILDEPTHGLDPLWTQRFRDVVESERRPDRLIIIASHNLDELERLADRVAILDRGALVRVADAGDHGGDGAGVWRLVLTAQHPALLTHFPGATKSTQARELSFDVHGTVDDLNVRLQRALADGLRVRAFFPAQSRLEAAFRDAVQGGGGA